MTNTDIVKMCTLVDKGCIKEETIYHFDAPLLSKEDWDASLGCGLSKAGETSAYISDDISTVSDAIKKIANDFENYKEKNMKKEVLFLAPGWPYAQTVIKNLSRTFDRKKIPYVATSDEFETNNVHVKFNITDPLKWYEEMFRGKSAIFGKKELVDAARSRFFHVMPGTPKMSLEKYIIENTVFETKPAPTRTSYLPEIEKVHFSGPATTVIWADGTKTTVKCQDGDIYSEETGMALCISKKAFGNMPNFNNIFKKHIPENCSYTKWAKLLMDRVEADNRKTKAVETAYKTLVEYRDAAENGCLDIDELIGYLGEALQ